MNDPGELLLFQTEDGTSRLEVRLVNETVWLSAGQIAELFQRDKSTISRHIQNVYDEGELKSEGTVALFATVQREGGREVTRDIEHYSLDVIISVGYRVKSHRGVQFRVWATQQLLDYLVKGFVLNDEKFKQGRASNYFDQLLARIRDIRSSEKEFWHLDFATLQATNQRPMYMRDWIAKLDQFLQLSEREILTHAGSITADAARPLAEQEYDKYRRSLDSQPSPVEVHFEEAVMKAKQLAEPGKMTGGEK